MEPDEVLLLPPRNFLLIDLCSSLPLGQDMSIQDRTLRDTSSILSLSLFRLTLKKLTACFPLHIVEPTLKQFTSSSYPNWYTDVR